MNLTGRKISRTIVTERGTAFGVFAETPRYLACHEPAGNADTVGQALLDLEWMALNGYFLAHHYTGPDAYLIFEKRPAR